MKTRFLALPLALATLFFSCQPENLVPATEEAQTISVDEMIPVGEVFAEMTLGEDTDKGEQAILARTSGFTETYESGSKTAYVTGSVSFSSGTWSLSDALTGTSSSDRKYSSRSIRMRNSGYARMSFDMDNGVQTVKVRHAKYGSDGNSTWRFVVSYDGGGSWYYLGNTVTTSSTSLQTVTVTVNSTSRTRLGIMKTSGGSNRVNFDNFEISAAAASASASRDNNMTFGNPSSAGSSSNNYLVSRNEYSYAYDNSRGRAKWVSWHLSTAWMGSASRQNDFRTDTSLPSSFYRAGSTSYSGSGFDRGHLCPSADRTYTTSANSATFYMSNMMPQSPRNNQNTWNYFESYLRKLANEGNEIHIVAGPAGQGGTGSKGYASTIDGGNIDVPSSTWKVALVLPNGSSDVSRVNNSTRIIAVNIPNNQTHSTSWGSHRTSVDYIESITGLNLFANISNTYEGTLEARIDNGPTN